MYTISNTFSFALERNSIDISKKFTASFDVVSLFTNIPLQECIDLGVLYSTDGNSDLKLSKSEFNKHLSITTA